MQHAWLTDPDLALEDLMSKCLEVVPVFLRHEMLCVGCFIGPFHTVIHACAEYGLDIDAFYAELAACITPLQSTAQPAGGDHTL